MQHCRGSIYQPQEAKKYIVCIIYTSFSIVRSYLQAQASLALLLAATTSLWLLHCSLQSGNQLLVHDIIRGYYILVVLVLILIDEETSSGASLISSISNKQQVLMFQERGTSTNNFYAPLLFNLHIS